MAVEDVERHGGDERIAQRVLLVQEARIGTRLHIVPQAPLAHDERHALAGVVLVHHRGVPRDQVFHVQRLLQGREPFSFRELGGRAFVCPGADDRVVVQVETVDHAARVAHHDVRPMDVFGVRSGRDPEGAGRAVSREERGEALIDVGVVLGRHVAAAAPAFVAHPPEAHAPGRGAAVLLAQRGHRARAIEAHVLPPFGHLARGAAADVAHDERNGAESIDQLQVLMGPEAVVLRDVPPHRIDDGGALLRRADPVLPVVAIGEAAARPADVRDLDLAEGRDDVVAQVPAAGPALRPEAVVDVAPQVLGELAVEVAADGVASLVSVDHDAGVLPERRDG